MTVAARRAPWTGTRRKVLLTIHITSAVALLGSTAGYLVLAARAVTRDDQANAHALYEAAGQLPLVLGIPLSFVALVSGILTGLTSKWGVLRHWWVLAKLLLLVGVVLLGALLNSTMTDTMLAATAPDGDGDDSAGWVLVGSLTAQLVMLSTATALSVFKPGGRVRAG